MNLLGYVNLILPAIGERAVTSLEVRNPTVAVLLPLFDINRRTFLKKNGGWWFNKFDTTLYPDAEGEIVVGTECLSFVAEQENVSIRGNRLYNGSTLSFKFDGPVRGVITQDIPFDELPDSARDYVGYATMVQHYIVDLGVTNEVGEWKALAGSAWSSVLAEHLRHAKHSTRKSKHWRKFTNSLRS